VNAAIRDRPAALFHKREGGEPKFSPLCWVACEMGFMKINLYRSAASSSLSCEPWRRQPRSFRFARKWFASLKQPEFLVIAKRDQCAVVIRSLVSGFYTEKPGQSVMPWQETCRRLGPLASN
jgi:hypothetical protein